MEGKRGKPALCGLEVIIVRLLLLREAILLVVRQTAAPLAPDLVYESDLSEE
jgi:hypothetical protein